MPRNTTEWLFATPIIALAIIIMVVSFFVLPVIGFTYYSARAYVRLIEKIGLGDN